MLSILKITNLAIVEELEIELSKGLNVITGDTGSGKTIILKAIELLLGQRARNDVIRTGAQKCQIEGLFCLLEDVQKQIVSKYDEAQEILNGQELLINRVVERDGKSKLYINGKLSTSFQVSEICDCILDITSQHEQSKLFDVSNHLSLLDSFGVDKKLLEDVRFAYKDFISAKENLEQFISLSASKTEYLERIKEEKKELEEAGLNNEEYIKIKEEFELSKHSETLIELLKESINTLESQDGLLDNIKRLKNLISQAHKIDKNLLDIENSTQSITLEIQELSQVLAQYFSRISIDPERLEFIRDRIALYAKLKRKYSKEIPQIIEYFEKIKTEISKFDLGSFERERLEKEVKEKEVRLEKLEVELSNLRKKVAQKLSTEVEKNLQNLEMKKARFFVDVSFKPSSSNGVDKVVFMFSANPGEDLKPISKVASGGEISRVFLILKCLLNTANTACVQIFDEVDVGVSGSVAQAIGEKLKAISRSAQVIIVTHSAQIAVLADAHYYVSKNTLKEKTTTNVKLLNKQERITELARMMSGKTITEKSTELARELLKAAN